MEKQLREKLYLCFLFTIFTAMSQTPGGVGTNLNLWLKADNGVARSGTNVTTWNDQSSNSLNGSAFNTPTFVENANNYNPAISFNRSSNEYIDLPNGFANFTAGISIYVVAKNTSNENNNWERYIEFANGAGNNNILFARSATSNNGAFEVYNGGSSSGRATANNLIINNANNIYATVMAGGTSGTERTPKIYRNGLSINASDPTGVPQNVTRTNNYIARSNWGGDAYFNGEISEVIVYNGSNSPINHQKIESYLAIKYGITLSSTDSDVTITEGDYTLSDGTKVWDFSTNNLYHHDVAGIGRDDGSGLNQKQSKSANSNTVVSIGLGEIATNNTTNTNTFTNDKDFLIWGNNNASLILQSSELPSGASATHRLGREWKVSENGNVNDVTISFSGVPSNAVNLELYVDTDGDGDFSNASVVPTGTLVNGNAVFSGINLENNYVFTLGYSINNIYPGGVSSNLNLWLKADSGVSHTGNNVNSWNDNSLNFLNGTAVNTPTLATNANNFNPAIVFNRANEEYIDLPDGFANFTTGISAYVVAKNTSTGNWERYFDFGNGASNNNILFARNGTNTAGAFEAYYGSQNNVALAPNMITNNENSIYGVVMRGGSPGEEEEPTIYKNGLSIINTNNTHVPENVIRTDNYIARSNWDTDAYFNGEISEIILFNKNNTMAEHQKIKSYLAIKYGITLDVTNSSPSITEGDYILSDGTTKVWDYTANNAYHNDVAGIGLDAVSSLNQKQSKSVNSDAIVTIGLGGIFTSNQANTNTFTTDKDFLIWGNNNGSTTIQATELPTVASATRRLGREWKVSKNGNPNNLTIAFDITQTNITNIELFVDTDGDGNFTNATVISGGQIIDGKATFIGVNLNHNDVFTLGYSIFNGVVGYKGPGGVGNTDGSTELSLWLDANTISGVTTGNRLTTWNDNSGKNNNATQGFNPYRGTYNTNQINGYPSINFDGSNDSYTVTYTPVAGSADRTIMAVINNAQNSPSRSYRHVVHYGNNSTNQAYGIAYKTLNSQTGGGTNIGNHYWGNGLSGSIAFTNATTIINTEYGSGVDSVYVNNGFSGRKTVALSTGNGNLQIGSRINGGNEYMQGQIGEVIVFNSKVNDAQRIIIDNYLAAKYGVTLASNDFYNEDGVANGNFDHDVAGIGQATDGTKHQDSQGTGIIRINTPSSLVNDSYLFWGRDNKNAISFASSPAYTQRLSTKWRVSKRNNLGTVTVEVDFTGIDISAKQPCAPFKLVVDNNSDLASPTAVYNFTNITGNIYRATGVNFADNDYFTIEYVDTVVIDNTRAYNGAGTLSVPNTTDNCYKLLVKNTANGTVTLTENATVKEIEVEAGGTLVVNDNVRLQVTNGLVNNGEIRLLGTSQLIQTHIGTKQVSGSGNLYKDKRGVLTNVYQSGYWTSPVTTNGSTFTIAGVLKDGTSPTTATSNPSDINFTAANVLDGATTNPITISGRWLAKLINATDWTRQINPNTEVFNPGEGWNMKSTGRAGGQNFTFKGIPNDGSYVSTIGSARLSLLGNPYPSALDADQFITDNTSAINGTLYLFDSEGVNSHNRIPYNQGYATRVFGIGNPKSAGGKTPGKYIDVGQAFFVVRNASGNGIVSFRNSQRAFNTSSEFFSRPSNFEDKTDFPIIRLGLEFNIQNNRKFRRIVSVGFRGLTNNYEVGYEAEMFDRHPTDFGLAVNNRKEPFVITGVANFNANMEIPLQVFLDETKEVSFNVEEMLNLSTNVYIKDIVENKYYNITTQPKTIKLSAGDYLKRFSVVFTKPENSLSVDKDNIEERTTVFVNNSLNKLVVQKPSNTKIEEIKLYSVLGQEVLSWKKIPTGNKFQLPLKGVKPAVYILRVKTHKGFISKKMVIEF